MTRSVLSNELAVETEATASLPPGLRERRRLNLGCGLKPLPDAVNLDSLPETNADVIHNLDQRPWPLPDNHFAEVLAFDVLEHLDDPIATFEEIHRVSRDGALVRITVPHFSCANAFTDPTHRRYFGYFSFGYVTGSNEFSFYTRARFRQRACQIVFYPTLLSKIIRRLANRYPEAYERRWAWIFPAWFISVELEALKETTPNARPLIDEAGALAETQAGALPKG